MTLRGGDAIRAEYDDCGEAVAGVVEMNILDHYNKELATRLVSVLKNGESPHQSQSQQQQHARGEVERWCQSWEERYSEAPPALKESIFEAVPVFAAYAEQAFDHISRIADAPEQDIDEAWRKHGCLSMGYGTVVVKRVNVLRLHLPLSCFPADVDEEGIAEMLHAALPGKEGEIKLRVQEYVVRDREDKDAVVGRGATPLLYFHAHIVVSERRRLVFEFSSKSLREGIGRLAHRVQKARLEEETKRVHDDDHDDQERPIEKKARVGGE